MNEWNSKANELFADAINLESQDRQAFLDRECGKDNELRKAVEYLLDAHARAGSFLEGPAEGLGPAGMARTVDVDPAALAAGLSATFASDAAVVIGDANHSVLKSIGKRLTAVPKVTLRDEAVQDGPVIKPSSKEQPIGDLDSRYQLHGEIARGGMGAIIKGRDADLGRDLAIKVLLDAHKDKPEVVERFVEEAQIGGQLQHPGIVPVYELGQFSDERPFFSMKLVKGKTLATLLVERVDPQQDQAQFLGIFEQVCQTMAYAHSRGVIHRDLKPANIMVGAFGEVQVMDWGLAKVLNEGGVADERKSLEKHQDVSIIRTRRSEGSDAPDSVGSGAETNMGSVLGTPAYMPPEQALGEIDRLDERADVFGLGAILCEILTGKPPYVGSDGNDVFRLATRGNLDPCYERLEACGADPELRALVGNALALEPEQRWRNAGALSDELTHYLNSVQQRLKQAELEKAEAETRAREEQRRRKLYYAIGVILLMFTIGAGLLAQQFLRQRNRAVALLTDLRQELEEKVFRSVMAGDETKAELAIRQAESAGVSSDKIRLFTGMRALYYGRPDEAIEHLAPIANNSIAATGIVSFAADCSTDWDNSRLFKLERMIEQSHDTMTYEDKLFAGIALINGDMIMGRRLVEEAFTERATAPFAEWVSAFTRGCYGHNTNRVSEVRAALKDMKSAMRWVGDTPMLVHGFHSIQEQALVFGIADEAGIEAEQIYDEWGIVSSFPFGRISAIRLLSAMDDPQVPTLVADAVSMSGYRDNEFAYYVPILLRYKSPEDVLASLGWKKIAPQALKHRAATQLMALIPDRREVAINQSTRLFMTTDDPWEKLDFVYTLLVLGEVEEVRRLAAQFQKDPQDGMWHTKESLLFVANPNADVDTFLDAARPVASHLAIAEYTVGILRLAEGDLASAQVHLQNCLDSKALHLEHYWWARTLLKAVKGELDWEMP